MHVFILCRNVLLLPARLQFFSIQCFHLFCTKTKKKKHTQNTQFCFVLLDIPRMHFTFCRSALYCFLWGFFIWILIEYYGFDEFVHNPSKRNHDKRSSWFHNTHTHTHTPLCGGEQTFKKKKWKYFHDELLVIRRHFEHTHTQHVLKILIILHWNVALFFLLSFHTWKSLMKWSKWLIRYDYLYWTESDSYTECMCVYVHYSFSDNFMGFLWRFMWWYVHHRDRIIFTWTDFKSHTHTHIQSYKPRHKESLLQCSANFSFIQRSISRN